MQDFLWVLSNITLTDLLDIFIVAMLFFIISYALRGTQAVVLVRGVLITALVLVTFVVVFNLQALGWLLSNAITVLAIAIPIIFQPELRRLLERIGRAGSLFGRLAPESVREQIINEIVRAAERLSERRHGALIVLQRNSPLDDFINTGVQINSLVKSELLLTIFWPKTELHDGAVMIDKNGVIASAAAVLPLTANRNLPNKKMGTRHRAALGMSEVSDAICVIVSEETGRISITNNGRMVSRLDIERLRTILTAFYLPNQDQEMNVVLRGRRWLASLAARLQPSQPAPGRESAT